MHKHYLFFLFLFAFFINNVDIFASGNDVCDLVEYNNRAIIMAENNDNSRIILMSQQIIDKCSQYMTNVEKSIVYWNMADAYYYINDYKNSVYFADECINYDYLRISCYSTGINALLKMNDNKKARQLFKAMDGLYLQFYNKKLIHLSNYRYYNDSFIRYEEQYKIYKNNTIFK